MSLADGESEDHEDCHGSELGPRRDVLEKRAPAQSDNVDAGEDGAQQQPGRRKLRGGKCTVRPSRETWSRVRRTRRRRTAKSRRRGPTPEKTTLDSAKARQYLWR